MQLLRQYNYNYNEGFHGLNWIGFKSEIRINYEFIFPQGLSIIAGVNLGDGYLYIFISSVFLGGSF